MLGVQSRYWRADAVTETISEIRLPPNTWDLEEEFWGLVDAIPSEALEKKQQVLALGRLGSKQADPCHT
jgi:hypothetical protein